MTWLFDIFYETVATTNELAIVASNRNASAFIELVHADIAGAHGWVKYRIGRDDIIINYLLQFYAFDKKISTKSSGHGNPEDISHH